MSRAVSKDPDRAAARFDAQVRRAAADAVRVAKILDLRAWHDARRTAADKRRQAAADAPRGPRGVDRVPERLQGLAVTVEDHTHGKRPDAGGDLVAIDSTTHTAKIQGRYVTANHATRRAHGARGHQRRPRRRELPGAVQRRMQRAQKAWQS